MSTILAYILESCHLSRVMDTKGIIDSADPFIPKLPYDKEIISVKRIDAFPTHKASDYFGLDISFATTKNKFIAPQLRIYPAPGPRYVLFVPQTAIGWSICPDSIQMEGTLNSAATA